MRRNFEKSLVSWVLMVGLLLPFYQPIPAGANPEQTNPRARSRHPLEIRLVENQSRETAPAPVVAFLESPVLAEANIVVTPLELDSTLCPYQLETQPMTICNTGDAPLTWNLVESGGGLAKPAPLVTHPARGIVKPGSALLTLQGPPRPPAEFQPAPLEAWSFWDQPLSTVYQQAYVNQEFLDFPDYTAFLADDFTSEDPVWINAIFVDGNGWGSFTSLLNAESLTWQIYGDSNGIPDGDPSGGGNPPIWSLTLPPDDPQVFLTNGTPGGMPSNTYIALNVPLVVPPGHWWLVFYPSMAFVVGGQYGRQPSDTMNLNIAQFINPGGGFGYGTEWIPATEIGLPGQDIAFRLEASCCLPPIPWLYEDPTIGFLPPGECQVVEVEFDSAEMQPGEYFGELNVNSNDPDEPQITIPVSLTILQPADLSEVAYTAAGLRVEFEATAGGASPLNYAWDFGDGTTSDLEDPAHTYDATGCYQVSLVVTNACGEDTWTGEVCVCDPPVADFTFAPAEPVAGETVIFTGTATGDEPLAFAWDFGDGITATGAIAEHAFAAAGSYPMTLTVTNGCGTGVVEHIVLVGEPPCNEPGGIGLTWEPEEPVMGEVVNITGTVLTGTLPLTYTWEFSDGATALGQWITRTFEMSGTYGVTLTVSNWCGAGEITQEITVVEPILPCIEPVGEFSWLPAEPVAGEPVLFNALATGTPPFVFEWAFGDGITATGQILTHTYAEAGAYPVTLSVTNGCGIDIGEADLSVIAPPQPPEYTAYLAVIPKAYIWP